MAWGIGRCRPTGSHRSTSLLVRHWRHPHRSSSIPPLRPVAAPAPPAGVGTWALARFADGHCIYLDRHHERAIRGVARARPATRVYAAARGRHPVPSSIAAVARVGRFGVVAAARSQLLHWGSDGVGGRHVRLVTERGVLCMRRAAARRQEARGCTGGWAARGSRGMRGEEAGWKGVNLTGHYSYCNRPS